MAARKVTSVDEEDRKRSKAGAVQKGTKKEA